MNHAEPMNSGEQIMSVDDPPIQHGQTIDNEDEAVPGSCMSVDPETMEGLKGPSTTETKRSASPTAEGASARTKNSLQLPDNQNAKGTRDPSPNTGSCMSIDAETTEEVQGPRMAGTKRSAAPPLTTEDRAHATGAESYMHRSKNPSPDTVRRKWEHVSQNRHKKRAERLRGKFPSKLKAMDLADIEVPKVELKSAHHATKGHSEGFRASQTKVNENEQRGKIEKWETGRNRIESRYPHGRWPVATFHERFLELIAWFSNQPLGSMVPPAAIPWPVFKKPYSIEPADVTTEEVGLFLHSLQHSTDRATFAGHLKNLRVRFHPDRWRGELLKVEDTEERERWERALVNTSQAISGFGNDEIEEVINGLSASYSPSTTGSEDVEKIFPGVRHRGIVGRATWGEAPNDASPPISPDMGIGGYPR
ncbi:hypothetical protein HD554DRAFT_2042981 [Boletus coccyginus]|nr:hypothetical protein HD554DRAFT_2042981 [Boletus coccyginus]